MGIHHSVQCTVCSVQCTVYSVQCAVYSVQCAVYSVQCAVCSVQCTVYTVQWQIQDFNKGEEKVTSGYPLTCVFFCMPTPTIA